MHAVLVTGFNNWGKTEQIRALFNKKRFSSEPHPTVHASSNTEFLVESRFNDDFGEVRFVETIRRRYQEANQELDLIAAFCPSQEENNDSLRILRSAPFQIFEKIHIFLLQYKWDWHAELRLSDVQSYLSADPRVSFHVIDADTLHTTDPTRLAARNAQIGTELGKLFP